MNKRSQRDSVGAVERVDSAHSTQVTRGCRAIVLSDLRLGSSRERFTSACSLWDKASLPDTGGPCEFSFLLGNISDGGEMGYDEVDRFLSYMNNRFTRQRPVTLLAVPGVCDVRRVDATIAARVLSQQFENDKDVRSEVFTLPQSYSARLVAYAMEPFARWWQRCFSRIPSSMRAQCGQIAGDFSLSIIDRGLRVGVLGLNTVFLTLLSEQAGNWRLDPRQVDAACGGSFARWATDHDLLMTLSATPFSLAAMQVAMPPVISLAGCADGDFVHARTIPDALMRFTLFDLRARTDREVVSTRAFMNEPEVQPLHQNIALAGLPARSPLQITQDELAELSAWTLDHPISREALDRLLCAVLPESKDINRFARVHFPDVEEDLWPGLAYAARRKMLLERKTPAEILNRLFKSSTHDVLRHQHLIRVVP
ncbi:hypothetical protein KBA73_02655 [Patescibacteria group bacterium]|nr:hypothetical protein [Patescibacteria group bacterium]